MHESYYSLKPRCGSEEMLERIRHNPPIYISLYEVLYYDDCLYQQRYSKSMIAKLEGTRKNALIFYLHDGSQINVFLHKERVNILFHIKSLTLKTAFIQLVRGNE